METERHSCHEIIIKNKLIKKKNNKPFDAWVTCLQLQSHALKDCHSRRQSCPKLHFTLCLFFVFFKPTSHLYFYSCKITYIGSLLSLWECFFSKGEVLVLKQIDPCYNASVKIIFSVKSSPSDSFRMLHHCIWLFHFFLFIILSIVF